MVQTRNILTLAFLFFFCLNISAHEKPKMQVVSFNVAIPMLPDMWRMPTSEELDHVMRPQSLNLMPAHIFQITIDNDSRFDWAIIAVKKDLSVVGLLIYLSSDGEWHEVSIDDFRNTDTINKSINTERCGARSKVIYSSTGKLGTIYTWDNVANKIVSELEVIAH